MISPLVHCGARMSMAGRMSRTGPALKSKGGPGPCTAPGPITGITSSSRFHPLHPLTAAWHCALADWRAQTGCCEAGTGSGRGGRGRRRHHYQPGNTAPPSRPPTPQTNQPPTALPIPDPRLLNQASELQGLTVCLEILTDLLSHRSGCRVVVGGSARWGLPAVTPAGSLCFYSPFAI